MRQPFTLAFTLLVMLLLVSCEKEEIDNSDKNFPIQLSIEAIGQLNMLSWTTTNISTFEEYILVKSIDSIPANLAPLASQVITRIDDFEETSFTDAAISFSENFYYKVYVDIGGRFLESPTLKVTQKILSYDFIADRILYDAASDVFFLYSFADQHLSRYDVAENRITHTIDNIPTFRNFVLGTNGSNRELYVSSQSNGLISIYNTEDLSLISEFSVGREVYGLATNDRGLLFCSTDFINDPFRVYRRSDFLLVGSANLPQFSTDRRLVMLDPANNEVIEATPSDLYYYRFAEDGKLLESRANTQVNGVLLNSIRVSPDGSQFIPYRDGQVYNGDLGLDIFTGNFGNDVSDYLFSPNGSRIAVGFSFFGFVQTLSFPQFQVQSGNDVFLNGVQYLYPVGANTDFFYVLGWLDSGFETRSFIRILQF